MDVDAQGPRVLLSESEADVGYVSRYCTLLKKVYFVSLVLLIFPFPGKSKAQRKGRAVKGLTLETLPCGTMCAKSK